ncbi:hypothetical protein ABIA99_004285 [Bradyrhizobium sp. LB12.1]
MNDAERSAYETMKAEGEVRDTYDKGSKEYEEADRRFKEAEREYNRIRR